VGQANSRGDKGTRRQGDKAIRWLWDFGPKTSVRLSETWRKKMARQFDWTTRVLVILQN